MNFEIAVSEKKVFKEYLWGGPTFLVDKGLLWILFHKNILVVLRNPLDLVPISSFYRSRCSNWLKEKWNLFDVDFLKTPEVKKLYDLYKLKENEDFYLFVVNKKSRFEIWSCPVNYGSWIFRLHVNQHTLSDEHCW